MTKQPDQADIEAVANSLSPGCIHALMKPSDWFGFVGWRHFERIANERGDLLNGFWQRLNCKGQAVRAHLLKERADGK